jgi:hypothetical protein
MRSSKALLSRLGFVALALGLALAAADAHAWGLAGPRHLPRAEPGVFPKSVDPWKLWGLRGLATLPQPGDPHARPQVPAHAVWVPACWAWDGNRWVWVQGHWRW